jgi:CRP/FNR family cyclic AMP-dependent transcriptional regulator
MAPKPRIQPLPAEVRLLAKTSLFAEVPPEGLRALASQMERRRFRAGEVIYHRRDVPNGLFVILKGEVKTRIVLADDRSLTFQWFRAGGYFGMNSLISETDRFTDAVAVTDCETLFLPRDVFAGVLDCYPAAMRALLRVMASMYLVATEKIQDLAFLDIRGRTAKVLLQLAQRLGEDDGGEGRLVSMSQTELASLVGATRESTNKTLAFLEREGWISREKGGIRIRDEDALAARIEVG